MKPATKSILRAVRASPVGRMLNVPRRAFNALPIAGKPLVRMAIWTFTSREDTNYTYPLTDLNLRHLAHAIAAVTGADHEEAAGYIRELQQDRELAAHVTRLSATGDDRTISDDRADFAKRLGWYAVARILKPEVIVETGVDKGLGTVVLAAAILRNGHGRVYGTDIDPAAGRLLAGKYAAAGEVLYGDSIETLRALPHKIDLFINDSDHSADYEMREYETIADKLTDRAIVIGDNAHSTDKLAIWSERNGRNFLFWGEAPQNHWYPGGGIGFSYGSAPRV